MENVKEANNVLLKLDASKDPLCKEAADIIRQLLNKLFEEEDKND